jgi:hypothetical protein
MPVYQELGGLIAVKLLRLNGFEAYERFQNPKNKSRKIEHSTSPVFHAQVRYLLKVA